MPNQLLRLPSGHIFIPLHDDELDKYHTIYHFSYRGAVGLLGKLAPTSLNGWEVVAVYIEE